MLGADVMGPMAMAQPSPEALMEAMAAAAGGAQYGCGPGLGPQPGYLGVAGMAYAQAMQMQLQLLQQQAGVAQRMGLGAEYGLEMQLQMLQQVGVFYRPGVFGATEGQSIRSKSRRRSTECSSVEQGWAL
jgi:hypothetical protein